MNSIFSNLGTTIFETMSGLAVKYAAINLGQGFPEGLEPAPLLEYLAACAQAAPHQYPSMMGTMALRQAVARHEHSYWGYQPDPATEVMVTSGATEALAASLLALIEPGDKVLVLEPLYDSYLPIIRRGGGVPVCVRLEAPYWTLPREPIEAAFRQGVKVLIVNSPTNPSGKVFSFDELRFLADLACRYDATVISDEVYEHLTYDEQRHIPLSTLPGMAERTVKIGSAGKIFSVTGWKVGWIVAAPKLLGVIAKAHQFLTFTTPPMLQAAVAWGLDTQAEYYTTLATILAARRDRLSLGLSGAGFSVLPASGSYFLTADYLALTTQPDDVAFCMQLVERVGVAAIPVSAFYAENIPTGSIRFCFAKTDQAIDEAVIRLQAWRDGGKC
ncbi:aminotransferase [Candidatus Methylospira mobilis]|uniref:aminotransferase n=1 Tax=Candidatus Methylospira mobilis TaxID=1808979 RepID=UPI0028E90E07|nr:aminotransferase [Candidatus Methylospira mobilis]WNV04503.1 aminotransferase [Candidatus Methylospira mobilis]